MFLYTYVLICVYMYMCLYVYACVGIFIYVYILGRKFGTYCTRKIILRDKTIGYHINVIRQTACMVVNPITVNNFAYLFNCTPAG